MITQREILLCILLGIIVGIAVVVLAALIEEEQDMHSLAEEDLNGRSK